MRNLSLATTGMTVAVMALASVDALSFLGPLQGPALMTMSFCWVAYGAVRSMSGVKPKVQSSPSKVPVRSWCRRHLIPPSPTRMGMSPVTRRRPVFLRGNRTSQPISMANLAVVHSRRGQADVTLTLGNIQTHQGELDKARKTYEAAMKCHQMVGSDMGRANALSNIGNVRLREQKFDEARKLYLELGVRSHGAKAVEELIERLGGSRAQKVKDAKDAVAQADAEDADTGSADAGSAS